MTKHIYIERKHNLLLCEAQKLAQEWKESGEENYQLRCDIDEEDQEMTNFQRSGISGSLKTTETHFILSAQLGFLLKPYRERISKAIEDNLTERLNEFTSEQTK